jgi:phosphatidylglycerophosphatase A
MLKSLLKPKDVCFEDLKEQVFAIYSKEEIIDGVVKLLWDVKGVLELDRDVIEEAMMGIFSKNETYNILLTLLNLDDKCQYDVELQAEMKDPSYNAHRTIALNICDMYGTGATSFFGYIDCLFRKFFPEKRPKAFISKGICAIIASTAAIVITGTVEDYSQKNIELLVSRGVTMKHLTDMVLMLQVPYNPTLTYETCEQHVLGVLRKQQTYHTIHLCVKIDTGVEDGEFDAQFRSIVGNDEGLYGIDESINTTISKLYGMIAITNFGYLDKAKPGIIGELDSDHADGKCNTFLDDTVCAIVSAACARLAHNNVNTNSKPVELPPM